MTALLTILQVESSASSWTDHSPLWTVASLVVMLIASFWQHFLPPSSRLESWVLHARYPERDQQTTCLSPATHTS